MYSQALKEYRKLEKKYSDAEGDCIPVSKTPYLSSYFGSGQEGTLVSLAEAKRILEEDVDKCSITYDGQPLTCLLYTSDVYKRQADNNIK